MVKVLMAALILQAAVTNDGAPPAAATLRSTGEGQVEELGERCTLSYQFAENGSNIGLRIRPGTLGESFQLTLLLPGNDATSAGRAMIVLSPNQEREMTVPFERKLEAGQTALTMKGFGGADWYFAGTSRIRVALPDRVVDLAPTGFDRALLSLRACHDDLLSRWGVTPVERAFVGPLEAKDRAYAIGDPDRWFGADSYPRGAPAAQQEGSVTILWAIGLDGRAKDCRIISSSGVPELDAAACAAIVERGRYRPIRDANGNAIVLHAFRVVDWRLQ